MKEYKLFNTDGKTFFDFRSDPESRCEGFTVTFCDDGTVVMSGDYGTLCWKREHSGKRYDYGFPDIKTGIRYFDEKVCQWGVKQVTEEWDSVQAEKDIKEYLSGQYDILKTKDEDLDEEDLTKKKALVSFIEDMCFDSEPEMYKALSDLDTDLEDNNDFWEGKYGIKFNAQFEFMFKILQSVSEQIINAVKDNKDD